mmetsp:Transcript_18346/g.63646  ORF Transcript_18346/g.63646 Transcript_18346/m.63646 type:complete len:268 (+) Transcript_18346:1088-1891(+)
MVHVGVQPPPQPPEQAREAEGHADGVGDDREQHVGQPRVVRRAVAADRRVDAHDVDAVAVAAVVLCTREIPQAVRGRRGHEDVEREEDPIRSPGEDLVPPRPIHARVADRESDRDQEDEDDGEQGHEEKLVEVVEISEALRFGETDEAQIHDGSKLQGLFEDGGEAHLRERPRDAARDLVRRDDDLCFRHDVLLHGPSRRLLVVGALRVAAGGFSVFVIFVMLLELCLRDIFDCLALDDFANRVDPVTQNGEDAKLSHHDADGRDDK